MKFKYLPFIPILLVSSCSSINDDSFKISCSFAPIYDFVKNIVGDKAEVRCIVGNNEPHDFSLNDMRKREFIEKSDIFFTYGAGVDVWADNLLAKDNYEITKDVNLLSHDGSIDPHAWLSINYVKEFMISITNKIIEKDDINSEYYTSNLQKTLQNLNIFDLECKKIFSESNLKSRIIVTSHEAFYYFCNDYNLVQKGIKNIANHEPSTKELNEIIAYIKNNDIHTIFVESLDETEYVNTVVNELKRNNYEINLATLDAYETVTESTYVSRTYLDVMYENLNTLKENLL